MPDFRSFTEAARIFSDQLGEEVTLSTKPASKLRPAERLEDFMEYVFGLKPAQHHQEWITVLQDPKTYPRVLIISPPGHAKTTVAGVCYPAWKIGNFSQNHFLYYGNTQTQAEKQSTAIRDLMTSDKVQEVFPHVRRSRTKGWAGHQWFLEREAVWDKDPTMLALGVDGPGLGARADEILFDDVCDPQNMNTAESRRKVRDQVAAVAFSRQGGKSREANRMVAVMTRWHEDDLANFFEQEGFYTIWMPAQGYWEVVKPFREEFEREHGRPLQLSDLPKEMEMLTRLELEGGPLWPEEYDLDFFESFKKPESHHIWMLEYQGLAVRPGGNLWTPEHFLAWSNGQGHEEGCSLGQGCREGCGGPKWLDPYKIRGVFQFWDTANKASAQNDDWVCETWAWATDGYYMLDMYRGKHTFSSGVEKIRQLRVPHYLRDADNQAMGVQPRMVYIEETGTNNGSACLDVLRKERFLCEGITPTESKEERAGQAILAVKAAPFYFPMDDAAYEGTTRQEFISQHLAFPRGKHDDMADTTAMAIKHLSQYPIMAEAEWQKRATLNNRLTKDKVRGPGLMAKAGGTNARIKRGHFGATRRGKNQDDRYWD